MNIHHRMFHQQDLLLSTPKEKACTSPLLFGPSIFVLRY
ncbi:hypothetical protein B0H98_101642 [Vreelandella songnenensis]|uniref:Uncharacterized protein n=1 Tax=Vreelandella songnenensis TaxID=1176243 RepID=A0A2T0V947_9GAMM|nr:hypothetical protein B0H98_101642 [Halomonas songnenensis]